MNKSFYISSIFFTLLCLILLLLPKEKDDKTIEVPLNTSFSFYKEKNYERYLNYQKLTNLNDKKTIIRVNIGLDKPFYTDTKPCLNLNKASILVNKYCYLEKNYVPNNLISTSEYASHEIQMVNEAYESFKKMASDAKKDNYNIRIVSAYRSYDYQENLYNNYLSHDTKDVVDTYSARPGYSEHQTGLAIDIDNTIINYNKFHLTEEFTWMKLNAYKYGFILRYGLDKEDITGYKYEPWHYRYVGNKIAEYIYKNDLTYEEYYYEFLDN